MNLHPSKLPDVETSIFTVMSKMARKHNALNLSQGYPNFAADPVLIQHVAEAMKKGVNQYAPMEGVYSLREVISEKIASLYGKVYHPDHELTLTAGATQAIFTAITAVVHPGDEVIIFKPAYDCYEPAIKINGGVPVLLQMKGKDFHIDWEEFRSVITNKTKLVVINTPHNPSGMVLSQADMQQLGTSLRGTDILVLSDEVYEHMVFDGHTHESASKYPDLAERSFVIASFGKTFHVTGWKMGYCAAPASLMKEFRKIHEFNVFSVNHPIQNALVEYLSIKEHYLGLASLFQKKRNLFLGAIKNSRFKCIPSQGTYFQIVDYSEITEENDIDFSSRLVKEYGLASIPISVFNLNKLDHQQLRFCFAKTDETLYKAAEIMNRIH
ncbi:MAG: methionine aminotransferase [Eudoraea sp.]|nr:methionine aminotransferase [Eudoraea sp.]